MKKMNSFISLLFVMFLSLLNPLMSMRHIVNPERCIAQDDCVICSEPCNTENDFLTPCCRHYFHFDCLEEWIEQEPTCPMCRGALSLVDLRREYENQMKLREERRNFAREEEERQVQEAIRISLEEENLRQDEQCHAYIWRFEDRCGLVPPLNRIRHSHITVCFDQKVTKVFFGRFVKFLNSLLHKKRAYKSSIVSRKSPFIITYSTSISEENFQIFLNKANNYLGDYYV